MRQRRVALVIGDLPKSFARALEARKFLVEVKREPKEGEERSEHGNIDVCIVIAKKKEQLETIAKLRDLISPNEVPLIAVRIAGGEPFEEKDAVEMGADAFVSALKEEEFVDVVERVSDTMGGVVPKPENDTVVEKVFDIVSKLGENGRIVRKKKSERIKPGNYRVRSLEQLIETVEKELSSHPEVTRRVTSPLEKEELDVLDVEAEIEPFLTHAQKKERKDPPETEEENGISAESANENGWIAEHVFAPLYGILGCSLGDAKEELMKAYAVRSDRIRKLRASVIEAQTSEEIAVWKNAQRVLDSAFDVLSKETVRNFVKRSKLEK